MDKFSILLFLLLIIGCKNDSKELLQGQWGLFTITYNDEYILDSRNYDFYNPKGFFIDTESGHFNMYLDSIPISGKFIFSFEDNKVEMISSDNRFTGTYSLDLQKIKKSNRTEVYDLTLESERVFIYASRVLITNYK